MPQAGELRETITIKQAVETRSGTGAVVVDWANATVIATPRASIEPLRGKEQLDLAIAKAELDYRIWIRFRSGITPQQRIFWRTKELDIVSVSNFRTQNEWLEIMAKERRAA